MKITIPKPEICPHWHDVHSCTMKDQPCPNNTNACCEVVEPCPEGVLLGTGKLMAWSLNKDTVSLQGVELDLKAVEGKTGMLVFVPEEGL